MSAEVSEDILCNNLCQNVKAIRKQNEDMMSLTEARKFTRANMRESVIYYIKRTFLNVKNKNEMEVKRKLRKNNQKLKNWWHFQLFSKHIIFCNGGIRKGEE